ncbi:MAG: tetraacyldisaccharide 4'-kinase [Pseudomonadales bacterium]|nr:tetraacyldisaccharide 4'-kinase [Pseudomonadales bacterium]
MRSLEKAWYRKAGWLLLLWPVSLLFQLLASIRRFYHSAVARSQRPAVPVVVVGNISVGGTGKTPLIIGLAKALRKAGLRPGIISRGYLGKAPDYPFIVEKNSSAEEVGDEALLIARSLGDCPMVVDPDRLRALEKLCSSFHCDVVLSDDGLQHYALPRDLEIVVIDGKRLFGNGMCLPAGPLREPVSRLRSVPYLFINGEPEGDELPPELERAERLSLQPTFLVNLQTGEKKPFKGAPFNIGTTVHAVTGIGNPDRFFTLLSTLPYQVRRHDFPDHHPFSAADLEALAIDPRQPVVMTQKDAVKCEQFAGRNYWYLAVEMKLPDAALASLLETIQGLVEQRRGTVEAV